MYAALNQVGQLIYAHDGQKGQTYYCPKCHLPVQLICGTRQHRAHFRHYTNRNFAEGETTLHLQGKATLQKALQELGITADQEVTVGIDERRADVLFSLKEQHYAIEFQCALLSVNELRQRHLSYRILKVTDIWLLGRPYLDQPQSGFNKTALKFMAYRQGWGYFLAFWMPATTTMRLFHHIAYVPPSSKVVYQQLKCSLTVFLNGYLQSPQQLLALPQMALNYDPSYWLAQQLNFQRSSWLSLQTRCYQHGLNLMILPQELWLPQRLPPLSITWSQVLREQIDLFLAVGTLSWERRSQLYLQTRWPLVN